MSNFKKNAVAAVVGVSTVFGVGVGTAAMSAPVAHAATGYTNYTVRSGDTLTKLAAKYHTTVSAIASASGVKNVNSINVGQVLRIPSGTSSTSTAKPAPSSTSTTSASNVLQKKVIGYSVEHRPITAYLLGDAKASKTEMIIGNMHGDERFGSQTVNAMINGPKISGIKVWVIPTINPDGLAHDNRDNAHGVDLNGNFPNRWHSTAKGRYWSGPSANSEPETKAIYSFVASVKPQYLVSLHCPLFAVDNEDVKSSVLQHNLAKDLDLPIKHLSRATVSHGTMVGYINDTVAPTAAITIEYGPSPSVYQVNTQYRIGLIKAIGGTTK